MPTAAADTQLELGSLCSALAGALDPLREALASHSSIAAGVANELRALEMTRAQADELVRRGGFDAAQQAAAAEELRRCLARVLRLADCLAQLHPPVPQEIGQISLDERVERRLRALQPQIAARGLELAQRIPRALARGDVALLGRAVDELVDNAVVHNVPSGWLEVGTETLGSRVLLRVANGGPPISKEAAGTLTEPFRRLRPDQPGVGLGLTLVSRIVSAHDGTTWICGPPSGGLAVELELPGAPLEPASAPRRLRQDATCARP